MIQSPWAIGKEKVVFTDRNVVVVDVVFLFVCLPTVKVDALGTGDPGSDYPV